MQVNRAKCGIQRLILQGLLEPVPITACEAPAAALRTGTPLLSHVPSAGCPLPSSMQPRLDCKPASSYAVMSSMAPQPDAEPGASLSRTSGRIFYSGAEPASQHSLLGLAASSSSLSVSPDAQLHGSFAQSIPDWPEMPARGTLDAQLSAYSASAQQGPCSPQTSSNSDNSATQDGPSIAEAGTPAAASRRDFRGPISPEWLAAESPAVPAWAHQAGGHNRQDSQSAGDTSSPARPAAQDGGHLISRSSRVIASGNARAPLQAEKPSQCS